MNINVSVNISDDLLHGLREVLAIIDDINLSDDEEDVLIFRDNVFVTPLFILPLLAYTNFCAKRIRIQYNNRYLDAIHFGDRGLIPEQMEDWAFQDLLLQYSNKTYMPIISFPVHIRYNDKRNVILSVIERLLINQLGLQPNIAYGLKYLIGESVDNIIEHSDSERGYIFSQFYPQKKYLDICIADNGITLLGSYRKIGNDEYTNHLIAMQAANRGISTKNLPDAENRGYGIKTSKKMLVDGLSGNYVMLSGNALYLKSRTVDQFASLPEIATWQGTITAMRIPYMNKEFNYINFVE